MNAADFARVTSDKFLHSPLFQCWSDPRTGVQSHILTRRVAPIQQSFYFTNPSFSDDGRYFWFYCAFPPGGNANQGRSLGVADFHKNSVHHFPETVFTDASPLVDGRTGEVYWCAGLEIWKRSPDEEARPVLVNRFPEKLARNRRPWRLATHLTFSADRKAVNLDVEIGGEWFVGHAPLDGGEFVLWQKFDRCYNHGQFSPTDADLQLIAQDYSVHPMTGDVTPYENRLWLLHRSGEADPVFPESMAAGKRTRGPNQHYAADAPRAVVDERAMHGHEWWGADGQHIWYVHYDHGVERVSVSDVEKRQPELIWPHPALTHAHADSRERWLVADSLPGRDPDNHQVLFNNLATNRQIEIVSTLPNLPQKLSRYHVHPHPQFVLNDALICYTTTVLGSPDIAFVPVETLLSLT